MSQGLNRFWFPVVWSLAARHQRNNTKLKSVKKPRCTLCFGKHISQDRSWIKEVLTERPLNSVERKWVERWPWWFSHGRRQLRRVASSRLDRLWVSEEQVLTAQVQTQGVGGTCVGWGVTCRPSEHGQVPGDRLACPASHSFPVDDPPSSGDAVCAQTVRVHLNLGQHL